MEFKGTRKQRGRKERLERRVRGKGARLGKYKGKQLKRKENKANE